MRAWFTVIWFGFSATAAFTAESTSAAAALAPAASIDTAKRELDAIKAARNPAVQSGLDLPRIAAPELQLGSPSASPWSKRDRASKAQLEAERKAKNWLIEGVEKEKRLDRDGRDGRTERTQLESERVLAARDELRNNDADGETESVGTMATLEAESGRDSHEGRREREPAETPVSNPLAGYMAGWMTPQDFALLQPNVAATATAVPAGSGLANGNGPVASTVPASPAVTNGDIATGLFGAGKANGASAVLRENPYLAALAPPAQMEALFSAPPAGTAPPPAPSAPSVFQPAPLLESPATKSKVPEFARPTDDKYFKQLKRF